MIIGTEQEITHLSPQFYLFLNTNRLTYRPNVVKVRKLASCISWLRTSLHSVANEWNLIIIKYPYMALWCVIPNTHHIKPTNLIVFSTLILMGPFFHSDLTYYPNWPAMKGWAHHSACRCQQHMQTDTGLLVQKWHSVIIFVVDVEVWR